MPPEAITLPLDAIVQLCQRWKVQEFYLFGSVRKDDFRPDSDIDVMVQFVPDAHWGLEFVDIKQELEEIFKRKVDLLTKKSIEQSENWIRRRELPEEESDRLTTTAPHMVLLFKLR